MTRDLPLAQGPSIATTSPPTPKPFARACWVVSIASATLFAVIGVLAVWRGLAWSDTIWLVHVAGRMLDGGHLYTDIIEINPPLIFWFAMPIVAAARRIGVDPIDAYNSIVLVLSIGAVVCVSRIIGRCRAGWALWLVPLLSFAFLILPGRWMYGEREHLMMLLIMPWVALGALRAFHTPATSEAAFAGIGAGLAIALKPHWTFIALGVIAYQLRTSDLRQIVRQVEHWVILVVLTLYLVLVTVLTPAFFDVVRQLGGLYLSFHSQSLAEMLSRAEVWVAFGSLILYSSLRLLHRRSLPGPERSWLDGLAILLAGSILALLIQGKGLWYHYLPISIGSVALLGSLGALTRGWSRLLALAVVVGLGVLALGLRLEEAAGMLQPGERRYQDLHLAIERGGHPSSIFVLDPTGTIDPFRYMHYAHVQWSSSWPFLWPIYSLYQAESKGRDTVLFHPLQERPRIESWFVNETLREAEKQRPEILLVKTPDGLGVRALDVYGYFQQEQRFRDILRAYHEVPGAGVFRIFRRRNSGV